MLKAAGTFAVVYSTVDDVWAILIHRRERPTESFAIFKIC